MYSLDLVKRVLEIYNDRKYFNLIVDDIVKIYKISKSTIYEWINNKINIVNNKRVFNRKKSICEYDKCVIDHIIKCKVVKCNQLIDKIKEKYNKNISRKTIYNILKRNKYSCKRIQTNKYPYSKEKFNKDIKILKKQLKWRKNRVISVDETSIDFVKPSNYGWSKIGEKCTISISNKRKRISLLMAISKNKIVKCWSKNGSINGKFFNRFMKQIAKPNGKYKYLMDNVKIHHNKLMDPYVKNKIIYNLPYCPKYNPIEYVFNTLKDNIKKERIDNINKLKDLLNTKYKKKRFDSYFDKSYKNIGI